MDGFAVLPPGSSFNSHAAWQKLERRLPARRKKFAWYYMAAAALLLLVAVTAVLYQPDTSSVAGKQTQTTGKGNTAVAAAPQNNTGTSVAPVSDEKQKHHDNTSQPIVDYHPIFQDSSVVTSTTAVLQVREDSAAAPASILTPATGNIVINPVPQPPAIRIIHFNDLADDPYYRETEKKSRSNFSVTNPFKTEKNNNSEAPEQPRLKLPIIIN